MVEAEQNIKRYRRDHRAIDDAISSLVILSHLIKLEKRKVENGVVRVVSFLFSGIKSLILFRLSVMSIN